MSYDIFSTYPILKLFVAIVASIIGLIICTKNKFYNYNSNDMLFATKLKVFLSGILFIFIGICGFASYFF